LILKQSSDSFSFDVTNGISGLQDLVFHFRILPKTLYIDTRELVLTEGGNVNLAPNNIRVR
jgi:chondroitin sulfate proteoglycan 4